VRQLQTNPVETPVEILISGQADTDVKDELADIQTLRGIATQAINVLQQSQASLSCEMMGLPTAPK